MQGSSNFRLIFFETCFGWGRSTIIVIHPILRRLRKFIRSRICLRQHRILNVTFSSVPFRSVQFQTECVSTCQKSVGTPVPVAMMYCTSSEASTPAWVSTPEGPWNKSITELWSEWWESEDYTPPSPNHLHMTEIQELNVAGLARDAVPSARKWGFVIN